MLYNYTILLNLILQSGLAKSACVACTINRFRFCNIKRAAQKYNT